MKRFNRLVLCAALMAVAARCAALELTLEENRGESGSVGYVDIEKVFREYPETQRAKDAFKTELERKEKAILERKKEVFALRGEIARLKLEREFTLQLASAPLPAPAAKNASRAKKEAAAPVVPVSTQTIADNGVTAVVSSDTASSAEVVFSTTAMSPVAAIDYRIEAAQKRLATLETDFKVYQTAAEKEMVAFENRKTEIVLGKIYYALRELSVEESVSVVVDKKSILYGQKAVDLTDKLLRKLRGY